MSTSGEFEQTVTLASMYDPPITIDELREKLFYSALEQPGPTPPRDEEIYSLVYGYAKANEDKISERRSGYFSPRAGGGWICVGSQIAKLLAVLPDSSLNDLISVAKAEEFDAEVVK